MKKKIGMIGIGSMGRPMALNLLKAGYPLTVYDKLAQAVEEVVAAGAKKTKNIAELAEAAEVIITILPADREILEVYASEGGVIDHVQDGTVCLEMTSSRGETVREIEALAREKEKKIRFLDAPVSGGIQGAKSGTLTILVGGDRDLIEESRPILEAMGRKIIYTGALGSGKSAKMINQFLNAGNTCVAAEALYLGKRMGLDMEILCDVIDESSGGSWIFSNNVRKFMLPESFDQGFRMDLMKKDISLCMEQAFKDGLSMPLLNLIFQVYQSMCNRGYATKNYNAVGRWVKMLNSEKEA